MLEFLKIAGGVALILFGVRLFRKGLDRLVGPRMGHWMQRLSFNRFRAFVAGTLLGTLVPSSTTISLLAVQTVQAGQMAPRQMLAVVLGANIGMTVMVQLIALRLDEYAPILVLAGVLLHQLSRDYVARGLGQVILSLGLLFLAMQIIRTASGAALGSNGDLIQIVAIAEKYPIWLALIAMVLTMVLQSSTATLGLVIGLGSAIDHPLAAALPAVLGANVGLAVTTLAVGWKQVDSRNMAASNLLLKLTLAAAVLAVLPWVSSLIEQLPGSLAVEIAQAHTGFNVLVALVGLPLVGLIYKFASRVVPAPLAEPEKFGPKYLPAVSDVDSVPLALGQSMREIMRASELVRDMLAKLWQALQNNDEELARLVSERDDQIDLLDSQIKKFLTRTVTATHNPEDAFEQMRQLRYINEIETVGDIIDKNLSELVIKKVRLRAEFSREGWAELNDFYKKVSENLLIADTAFATRDRMLAQKLLRHKERLGQYEHELRDRHFARLKAGLNQSEETSAIHLDIITHLKRINSCVTHAAYDILESANHQSQR